MYPLISGTWRKVVCVRRAQHPVMKTNRQTSVLYMAKISKSINSSFPVLCRKWAKTSDWIWIWWTGSHWQHPLCLLSVRHILINRWHPTDHQTMQNSGRQHFVSMFFRKMICVVLKLSICSYMQPRHIAGSRIIYTQTQEIVNLTSNNWDFLSLLCANSISRARKLEKI